MAYTTSAKTEPLNAFNRTEHMGAVATRGGFVTLDADLVQYGSIIPELAKWFKVGATGDLVIENIDGTPIPFLNAQAGEKVIISGKRVLSTFDFGGAFGVVNTTASQICWYGGV